LSSLVALTTSANALYFVMEYLPFVFNIHALSLLNMFQATAFDMFFSSVSSANLLYYRVMVETVFFISSYTYHSLENLNLLSSNSKSDLSYKFKPKFCSLIPYTQLLSNTVWIVSYPLLKVLNMKSDLLYNSITAEYCLNWIVFPTFLLLLYKCMLKFSVTLTLFNYSRKLFESASFFRFLHVVYTVPALIIKNMLLVFVRRRRFCTEGI
jgi:hypothetical protein